MSRKLPPLSEMERIEQSMLGEKLDEILERIDKEDIAFVITGVAGTKQLSVLTGGSRKHSPKKSEVPLSARFDMSFPQNRKTRMLSVSSL